MTSDAVRIAAPGARIGRRETRLLLLGGGVLNAILFPIQASVEHAGPAGAIFATFGISAIVWVGLAMAAQFIAREPDAPLEMRELALDAGVLALLLVPLKHVGWIGLTLLALTILAHAPRRSSAARGGWILLAVTVPMVWSKLLFSTVSGTLLTLDAMMVGAVLGLPRTGNTLALADGTTHLWIEASCSSMLNVSLAILCWTMFCQAFSLSLRSNLAWCALGCATVVGLNVARISLIAAFPAQYDLIHGPLGSGVASWLTIAAMLGLYRFGMCRAV